MATLLVNYGTPEEAAFHFNEEDAPIVVGRDPSTAVTIDHPTVSRRHLQIEAKNGEWTVRDLGSSNGTFSGDKRLDSNPVALNHGSRLSIGGRLQLRFVSEVDTISAGQTPMNTTASWLPRVMFDQQSGEKLFGLLRLTPWLRFAAAILGLSAAVLSLIWWFNRVF